ncbi:hypothetical protein PFICI_12494 [Pestalotiopsis fici W106-1]|uniref:Uncharacterized protein n=1 Tax=Pestalotiopsis fici (strain W106-1 / CGMCC3.15140) TaxID=1229662 RepID=W3WNQ4_PESFW|nr:uncharacterized protein PFICI_12494 [Pestalotiopsis fici W106-1]ETS75550.1 hypothetical protein PFICI_12494 [Pestalotiopsis fici W106-1]
MASWSQNAVSAITIDSDSNADAPGEEELMNDEIDSQPELSEGNDEDEEDESDENDEDDDSSDDDDEEEEEEEESSSDGDSSDDDNPELKRWKADLATRLDSIQTAGDFAACNNVSVFANPGLEINGTSIPLPLVPRDADLLKAACRQAPFGRGEETVVDESVRKTWELDHTQFKLANPAWSEFLQHIAREATAKLGMLSVRVEPYKLLLYEEGSFFRRHKDSEKVAGMIGTLVICLPSRHEGGDVVLSLGGRTQRFSTSTASAYDLTALAWYSDVTHEITKLTSGYRLVLTYNIVQQGLQNPSPSDLIKQQTAIENLLQGSAKRFKGMKQMFYPLEHKYTRASLSLRNMKGRDRAVCQTLDLVCRKHGFYLLLANLTKTESCDDYDEEETSLDLDSVHSLDGQELSSYLEIEAKDIIGDNLYSQRGPDSEDEGEFTGNESMPSTYRYHDTAAMVIPKKHFHRLL